MFNDGWGIVGCNQHDDQRTYGSVSYTHLRAHETVLDLVCRLLLEKKTKKTKIKKKKHTNKTMNRLTEKIQY